MSTVHPNAPVAPPGTHFLLADNPHLDTSHFTLGIPTPHLFSFDLICKNGTKYTYTYKRQAGFDFNNKHHIKHSDLWKFQIFNRNKVLLKTHRPIWTAGSHTSYNRGKMSGSEVNQLVSQLPGQKETTIRERRATIKQINSRADFVSEEEEDEETIEDDEDSDYAPSTSGKNRVKSQTKQKRSREIYEVEAKDNGIPSFIGTNSTSTRRSSEREVRISYENGTNSRPLNSLPTSHITPYHEKKGADRMIEDDAFMGIVYTPGYPKNPEDPDKDYWCWVGYPR